MSIYDDVDREAMHDWLDERDLYDDRPTAADEADYEPDEDEDEA